jgi:adenosylcobinamide-GDP ribazoletransferase
MSLRSPTWVLLVKTDCPAWAPPLLAVQFLTRVPVPAVSQLSEEAVRVGLGRAVAWFPLIGSLVGAVTAGAMLFAAELWTPLVAVILALIVEARLTGAFHEDAVADFCDGVGGGRDPARVREIMKDSRIGSYGVLGLALALALRAALMYSLIASGLSVIAAAFAIVAASTFGRLLAVIAMVTTPPAPSTPVDAGSAPRDGSGSGPFSKTLGRDVAAGVRTQDVIVALITSLPGLLPFALNAPLAMLAAGAAAVVFLIWFRALLMRRVGGVTGDCLGFAAYAGQLLLLMAAAA